MMLKNISLLLVALFLTSGLFGQKLPSEQVEVLKKFEASLAKTKKLNTSPLLPAIEDISSKLTYNVPTKLLTLDYEPPTLKPLAIKRDKPDPTYKFYSKLGYGFPNMPFADIHYGSGADDNLAYELHAYHNSANNNRNQENQRFSTTLGRVDVTGFSDNYAIGGNIGYKRDVLHFYGYPNIADSIIFEADSIQQRFGTLQGGVHLFNSKLTNGDLNYDVGVNFHNLTDAYEGNEFGVDVFADFTKWIADAHAFRVKVGSDLTTFSGDSIRPTNNVIYFQPNFTYHGGMFQAKIGANLGTADSVFYAFPDIEAMVNLAGDRFAVIAGATGNIHKNTYLSVTDYNPFVNNTFETRNTKESYYYGGLRGNLTGFGFEAKVGFKQFKNLAMYMNDTLDTRRFNVLYDDANSVNVHGSITFTAIKNLEVGGTIELNTYTLDSMAAAWHLPNLEMNINATYKLLDDKLRLSGELYNAGGISYMDVNGDAVNTGTLFDLNLGADYQVTDKLGVFLDLNNVTNQKFQRWNNYPRFGFNMMAGVTLKF